jgi:antitoxin (DNA-binding transcriptional repressor) of toxin-antitoxin stability system
MKHQIVSVTEFKAKCLAYFDQIDREGGTLTITKRGRPLATVERPKRTPLKSSKGAWADKVRIVGDIANIETSNDWEVVREPNRFFSGKRK